MVAGCVTNPIDVIKVRLQLDNELSMKKNRYYPGFFRGILVIIKDEGFIGLFKGVSASVLREGVYSTFRLGAYEPVKGLLGASHSHSPLIKKMLAGAITGSIGSAIANPTDLVKIRMQGQGKLQPGEKPRYNGTFHAFRCIITKEGVPALWRGVAPTVQRAALLSAFQIPAYEHSKNKLKQYNYIQEGLSLHALSAILAGLVTSLVTSPVDVIKTRTMNENLASRGTVMYSSTWSSFYKIFKSEGACGFYKGFVPNWMRIGPHTFITFLLFEQFRIFFGLNPV